MLFQIAYLLLAGLGLGFLIFIHEMGHFWMAKRVGMTVEAFSIGFGAPIIKWHRNGVEWRIGWIPFGGYVKIAGERKDANQELHEVPGGFFSKKPVERIKVAAIAPLINLAFAFLLFTAIWLMGGREKPFYDLTNRIGWIDPKSELYQKGVRPGDEITLYNNRKVHGYKDIFQSTMLSKDLVRIQGYHYNYKEGTRTPFDLEVKAYQHPDLPEGIMTAGILAPANYLIYNKFQGEPNPLLTGSPMYNSGLSYGDRIVWVDGELIFSNSQLTSILNSQYALISAKRKDQTVLVKVPKVKIEEFKLSSDYYAELGDLKYENQLRAPLKSLVTLPYQISPHLEVEMPLRYSESESQNSTYLASNTEPKLAVGDKIESIDGIPVHNPTELFQHLQTHQFNIIVQKGNQSLPLIPWQQANATFENNINVNDIAYLEQQIGKSHEVQESGNLKLFKPVAPKNLLEIYQASNKPELVKAVTEAQKNPNFKLPLMLGVSFQDRTVNYNPPPYIFFGRVSGDVYQTLKALFSGGLNPKWLSGPIGIVQVMQQGWSLGLKEALYWLALISLNLGFLNLLPIPNLDGGQVCFALWEQVTKKPLKPKTMERITVPFMIIFIGLFLFVTFHDLSRLLKGIF